MKTIYEYYEDFETKKLIVNDYFDIRTNEDYKKIYDTLYYVGFCYDDLEDIEIDFEDFISLIKYADNIVSLDLKEEENLLGYIELLKRIPKNIKEENKEIYLSILENVYSKDFFETYGLEDKLNKKLYGDSTTLEQDTSIYILRDEYDKKIEDSLGLIYEKCENYPERFTDDVAYIFLSKHYEPEYLISCLPKRELVCKDYEAVCDKYLPYSIKLYEEYVDGNTELSNYPEEFEDYRIHKIGNKKVPFTKSEFIRSIEDKKIKKR